MEAKTTNWAIIGLGRIAQKFATDLKMIPGARLWAVASTDQARAEAFALKNEVRHAFGSYEKLLRCPEIDVVYVATPHPSHFSATMMCLEAGLPVLCEKPFAMNWEEANRMATTARRRGVFLMEAIWSRFVPGFELAVRMIEAGEIGEIQCVKADFGFLAPPFDPNSRIFNPKLGASSLLDIGIYPVFLALLMLGKPEEILAKATFSDLGIDETCSMIFSYPNKKTAILHSSITFTTPTEAHIFGSKGTIHLKNRFHHPKELVVSKYNDAGQLEHEKIDHGYEGWGLRFEAVHVMDCLEKGLTESPLLPLELTLDLMETLDRIRTECGIVYEKK